jgi:transposase-like protein
MREKQTLGKVQQRRSRAEVEQLVDVFESSGLQRREFCEKHGLAPGTLDFWRKRRREERGAVESGRLVAVELAGATSSGGLAVVLPRGRRVEVCEGFDAATLERLLAVLEQG